MISSLAAYSGVEGYKSVGWLPAAMLATPTTFRLFLVLEPWVSASSFWVGSTDTLRGLPSVTREDAIAIPATQLFGQLCGQWSVVRSVVKLLVG